MARMVMKQETELKRIKQPLNQFWCQPSTYSRSEMGALQSGVPYFLAHPGYGRMQDKIWISSTSIQHSICICLFFNSK
jgi:hypothetical protein